MGHGVWGVEDLTCAEFSPSWSTGMLRRMTIPRLPFGGTGHESSRILFGAAALGRVTQAEADRALEGLLEAGVNHIDTAAAYGDSELRVGA